MKDILFENGEPRNTSELFWPQPADKFLPDWYKDLSPYYDKKIRSNGQASVTAKKCMPLFDSMTSGYILSTYCDIDVSKEEGVYYFKWKPKVDLIDSHPGQQTGSYPGIDSKIGTVKYMNPWLIKTPPGYSCLFLPPMHRDNNLVILPGIVDTDKYTDFINFPFYVKEGFTGVIEAGTPLVQVIPFKRDSWKSKRGKSELLIEKTDVHNLIWSKFVNGYKNFYWSRKSYE